MLVNLHCKNKVFYLKINKLSGRCSGIRLLNISDDHLKGLFILITF